MLPIKKILCPIDFSDPSYRALDAAVELATEFGADLRLVNVVEDIPMAATAVQSGVAFDIEAYRKHLEESHTARLGDVAEKHVPAGVAAETEVLHGTPADTIINDAAGKSVDLVVISSHGWSAFDKLIFGSTAEKVARYCEQPVLIIRKP